MRSGLFLASVATLAAACGNSFQAPSYSSYPTSATLCEVDFTNTAGVTDNVTPNVACSSPGGDSGLQCRPYTATTSTPPPGPSSTEVQAYWCCGDMSTCDAHYHQLCSDPLVPLLCR